MYDADYKLVIITQDFLGGDTFFLSTSDLEPELPGDKWCANISHSFDQTIKKYMSVPIDWVNPKIVGTYTDDEAEKLTLVYGFRVPFDTNISAGTLYKIDIDGMEDSKLKQILCLALRTI